MDRSSRKKRTAMSLDSSSDEDTSASLLQSQSKKKKDDRISIPNLASGPHDFIKALTDAGFYPRSQGPNLLNVQQRDFQQSIREYLTSDIQYARNAEFFVNECDTFFKDRDNFVKALHFTENAATESSNTMNLPQDSLVRLLLNIDEVQPRLMAAILKRFTKATKEERPLATEVNLPSLILSQMAWLNRIIDPTLVVDTLLDLLNTSTSTIKKEIISHLPGLVADKEQIRVAFALCDMLNENTNDSLTAAVLDALGDLSLPSLEASELRTKVAKRILTVPIETIPVLLTFVFKRIQPDEASDLIQEIRLNFDRALKKRERVIQETVNDCISLAVESLQNSMMRSKPLADTWFKEIQSKTDAREHYLVDVLVLVIQHKFTGRRRAVELLFRKKMRSETFTTELVKETFQLYNCVLKNHFEQLCAIADSLLLTSDSLVIAYGSIFYQEMFIHFDEYYQQEVVQALIQHICSGGDRTSSPDSPATAALIVLQELADTKWEQLIRFSAFVVTMLEYIEYMALPQVKRVMELLAKMAYGFSITDESKKRLASFSASIQSELLMIIKKQLSHTRIEFQRMGILGSVALVHVLASPELVGDVSDDGELNQSSASSLTITDSSRSGVLTSDQRLKQAKTIINLVNVSTKRVPEVAALFMDEMASTSLMHDIHPSLHSHLYETVSESFQENFVVDETEQKIDNFSISLSLQYGLDTIEEDTPSVTLVFLNIAPMIFNEQNRKGKQGGEKENLPTITTLMSHFRLLRNTIDSFDLANLEDIDALLGCAICLPSNDVLDEFGTLAQSDKDAVCRCYFYSVNWFIEVINTFARAKLMRAKVIQRLRDVVDLKEKFFRCLAKNSTFMPPPCVFYGEPVRSRNVGTGAKAKGKKPQTKKKGKGGKKGKNKEDVENTTLAVATPNKTVFHSTPLDKTTNVSKFDFPVSQTEKGKAAQPEVVNSSYAVHFRELDFTAFVLLSSSLELTEDDSTTSVTLKPKDLELLLSDLAMKLEHKLVSSATKRNFPPKKQDGSDKESFVMLDLYAPMDVAKRSVSLIKRLAAQLETISGYFQQLIEMNDGLQDGPEMFNELAQCLGNSYMLIFRILNRIFSWNELKKTSGANVLEDALKYVAMRIRADAKSASFPELHGSCFDYIEKFSSSLTSFFCAVEHLQLLSTLYHHLPDPDLSERLSSIAEGHLKRAWNTAEGESEKGPKFNQGIESLLQIYLLHGTRALEKLEDIITIAMPEVLGPDGNEAEGFRTCNKATLPFYFRATFAALVEAVKKVPNPSTTPNSAKETLKSWSKVVHLLNSLVVTVKTNDKRTILITCLKYGRSVVELFYKTAMPFLDKQFKNFPNESQELVKNLQSSTRTLQTVCNHAKKSRDAILAAYIPAMKKIQEQLIYRVKAMLAANGCANAFWLGNLKNKDLQGKEILSSQSTDDEQAEPQNVSMSEEEEDEEEEDDDVTVMRDDPMEDEDSRSREF